MKMFLIRAIGIDFARIVKLTATEAIKVGPNFEFPEIRNKKMLKEINKQEREFVKIFEMNLVFDGEKNLQTKIFESISQYKSFLEDKNLKKIETGVKKSNFHLFVNGNLFLTSLLLYGVLQDDEKGNYVRDLVDNVEGDEKLSKMLQRGLENALGLEQFSVELLTTYKRKVVRDFNLNNRMMPVYDEVKGIGAYRSELKRSLLNSTKVKFKDLETLNEISKLLSNKQHMGLLEQIAPARYDLLARYPDSKFELILSENKKSLEYIRTTKNFEERKVLVHNIYYTDEQEYYDRYRDEDDN